MEIKVTCDCGTRFKFEIEPTEGKMPFPVNCPTCNVDATEKANTAITQILASHAPAAPKPKLSLSRPATPEAGSRPVAEPGTLGSPQVASQPEKERKSRSPARLAFGLLGTVVGGFIGMMIWYLIIRYTGYEIGIVAWGVGILAGLGARIAMPDGHPLLGAAAATCAFIGIVGGQYLTLRHHMDELIHNMTSILYEERAAYAQKAVKAKTPDEMKQLIAKERADGKEPPNPEAVTEDQLAEFRTVELPKLKAFANGKPTKSEFENEIRTEIMGKMTTWKMINDSAGIYTILWLFLGVGSAFKLAANEDAS